MARWLGFLVVAAGLAAGAEVAYAGYHAQDELKAARALLRRATGSALDVAVGSGRAQAISDAHEAVAATRSARRTLERSIVLPRLREIPLLGVQARGALDLAADAELVATAARDLLVGVDRLAGQAAIVDGAVPFDAVERLRDLLDEARNHLLEERQAEGRLWGPLGTARRTLDDIVTDSKTRLAGGSEALGAALPFMGRDDERTYLIAIQNNAEMRDQGMVLSYAIVQFDRGALRFGSHGSVLDLAVAEPVAVDLPAGTQEVFGPILPTSLWQSTNATADFALSGRTMAAMYESATGSAVDGVIGIDVPGLALLLAALGPVHVDGIAEAVSATSATRLLLHDQYRDVPRTDEPERREKLGEVTEAVVDRLTTGNQDGVEVGLRLAEAARGLHLRLWSAHPDEESVLERVGLGGSPANASSDRTFHLAVQNRTATKLDYFVHTSVRHDVHVAEDGDATVRTHLVIDNRAPPEAEASYQLGPDRVQSSPGEYHAWLLMWSPAGSQPATDSVPESGLLLNQRVVVVPAGTTREVALAPIVIPGAVRDGRLDLRFVPQPRLHPSPMEVDLTLDGWRTPGERRWAGTLDRVITVSWSLKR